MVVKIETLVFHFYQHFCNYKLIFFLFSSFALKNLKHHCVLMNIFFQFSIMTIYSSYHSFDTQVVPNLTNGTSSELGDVSL